MENDANYFNKKWTDVIRRLPNGGNYRFDLRKHGYQIICDYIGNGAKVFDYACELRMALFFYDQVRQLQADCFGECLDFLRRAAPSL